MTRQLEAKREQRQAKKDRALLIALEGGLEDDVARAGGVLTGFSARLAGVDCLLTVRATLAGKPQICFIGAESLVEAILKLGREARGDKLKWRVDKFA